MDNRVKKKKKKGERERESNVHEKIIVVIMYRRQYLHLVPSEIIQLPKEKWKRRSETD